MSDQTFISIGTKGTDIPKGLKRIEPPLVVGPNKLRWRDPGKVEAAVRAHGWVSRLIEPFEVYPLEQAIREGRVIHVPQIKWKAYTDGSIHVGEAFFRAPWSIGEQHKMVAVRSATWKPGCVGISVKVMQGPDAVGEFLWDGLQTRGATALPSRRGEPWTDAERLAVLNIYWKLPPGRVKENDPLVSQLAAKLGRVPNAIKLKVLDFAALDPRNRFQGHDQLQNPRPPDEAFWKRYQQDKENVLLNSEEEIRRVFQVGPDNSLEVSEAGFVARSERSVRPPTGETEVTASVKLRRGQDFFREMVLSNYGGCCAVTGINVRELLIASHIVRWADHAEHRLDVRNGICLSRLHDAAFDAGLIGFGPGFKLMLSKRLKQFFPQQILEASFAAFEGQRLRLPPGAISPNPQFLAEHLEKVFRS